jgi:hypothetical protein
MPLQRLLRLGAPQLDLRILLASRGASVMRNALRGPLVPLLDLLVARLPFHPDWTSNMQPQSPPRLLLSKGFLMFQVLGTILPLVGFRAAFLLLMAIYPPAAILVYIAACLYLLPAYLVVNHGFGYRTVEGTPFVPELASSPSSWLVLIATQAALVAVVFLVARVAPGLRGRVLGRHRV